MHLIEESVCVNLHFQSVNHGFIEAGKQKLELEN